MVLVCDGMVETEIAEVLNVTLNSVGTLKERARKKLGGGRLTKMVAEFVIRGWHPRLIAPDVLDDQDVSISPFTRAYLAYFDLHLCERERADHLRLMRVGFLGLFTERYLPVTPRAWYDPERSLDRVIDTILHWKNGMDLLKVEQEEIRLRDGTLADDNVRHRALFRPTNVYRVNVDG